MADSRQELKQKYKLTTQKIESIQRRIIAKSTRNVFPVHQPRAILLGGQPGAGKTGIQVLAEKELSYNAVVCNSDTLRDFHPKAREIKANYENEYPPITGPYSQEWTLGLQKHCRRNKLNYLLETTMQSGNGINQTINAIKGYGYQVDIKLMAVNGFLSLLGAYERLEDMRLKENVGRIVSRAEHDARYQALPEAIGEIHKAKLYDNLMIYGRSISDPAQGDSELRLIATNPADLVRVYLNERDRPWTKEERHIFKERVLRVEKMMIERKAPTPEIEEFKNNTTLPAQQKENLSEKQNKNLKGPRF